MTVDAPRYEAISYCHLHAILGFRNAFPDTWGQFSESYEPVPATVLLDVFNRITFSETSNRSVTSPDIMRPAPAPVGPFQVTKTNVDELTRLFPTIRTAYPAALPNREAAIRYIITIGLISQTYFYKLRQGANDIHARQNIEGWRWNDAAMPEDQQLVPWLRKVATVAGRERGSWWRRWPDLDEVNVLIKTVINHRFGYSFNLAERNGWLTRDACVDLLDIRLAPLFVASQGQVIRTETSPWEGIASIFRDEATDAGLNKLNEALIGARDRGATEIAKWYDSETVDEEQ